MDNNKKVTFKLPCYVVETKFCAGIFLSSQVASRKPGGKTAYFKRYESYEEAVQAFSEQYPDIVNTQSFRLNRFVQVRTRKIYSVFYNMNIVGIVLSNNYSENFERIYDGDVDFLCWRHDMEYSDALLFARSRFCRMRGDDKAYIHSGLCLNQVAFFDEVKRHNSKLCF